MFLLSQKCMSAGANMAADSMMLADWPLDDFPRLRFYDWDDAPAFTCGYSQCASDFCGILPAGTLLCKRPTGGGLVRHENDDITYALAVPHWHAFFRLRARDSYLGIHRDIINAARDFGLDCLLFEGCAKALSGPAQCFASPAFGDALYADGSKLAGAAQKRTKAGFLLQGSIKLPKNCGKGAFIAALSENFARTLSEKIEALGGFDFDSARLAELGAKYAPMRVP